MTRYFVTLILSVLGAPLIALVIAQGMRSPALAGAAEAALVASIVLPVTYVVLAFWIGRRRERLTRYFPTVVKVSMVTLVTFFVAEGLLLVGGVWLLVNTGHANHATPVLLVLGAVLLFAALLLVGSWEELLETEPLAIAGVMVEPHRAPELLERVSALAARLGAAPPTRVIVGLEPTAFVTRAAIDLNGRGVLPPGETLYLPALALRALSDSELDAVIGHELGHFRGEDLPFSATFVPTFAGLVARLERLNVEHRGESYWVHLARLPGLSLLSSMLYVFQLVVQRISHLREREADQAAVEAADETSVVCALVKMIVFGVQWSAFQQGNSTLVNHGLARRNLVADYLTRTAHLLALMDQGNLYNYILGTRHAHPLDSHPPFAERAAALGVDPEAAIDYCLPQLRQAVANDTYKELEEAVTTAEEEHARSPGVRLSLDKSDELPLALDLAPIAHRRTG